MPQLVKTEENMELLQEFYKLTDQYIQLSTKVLKPCRCFCRRTSCGCCFTSIFGENKQMGEVLATTFDGQHVWIKNNKNGRTKTKIDAMFFPATSEKFDKANLKAEKNFKKLPTFILCNPNAMFYQHMINYPHAYYLRFFLQKNINVMCWNYRGYARSKGGCCGCFKTMPDPDNIREDAEAILRYCRKDLGLRGKIGVYGRSLGGIATTHLSHYVDMAIVDRSFSNLYEVAYHKFYGYLAVLLFKLGTGNWDSNNDIRFYERGIQSEQRQADIL